MTQPHLSCRAHTALTLPHLRRHICAAALSPPHFAAAFTPPPARSSIYAPALTFLHSRRRTYAAAFTPPHLCCSIQVAAFFCRSHAATLMPSHAAAYLCRRIHASACTPPFVCRRMPAVACTPLSRRRIDTVALTPQHWRRRIHADSHAAAFFGRSISPPTSRCSIHAVLFTLPLAHRRICAAALAMALCRWKRTTRSAFSNSEHDTGGREPARAGRGGAGRGAVFEKGCFGVGWGGVLCTYMSPKGACEGGD